MNQNWPRFYEECFPGAWSGPGRERRHTQAVAPADLLMVFGSLPPCLIGVEACSASHHWARELTALGHQVRMMPAGYVKPYVQRGKKDALDAEAICEAVSRPTMRFAPIKMTEQQSLLALHP